MNPLRRTTALLVATLPPLLAVAVGTSTALAANADIRINEVESNGGSPGDWVELTNTGTSAVDVSGWVFKDNDNTHAFTIPAGTVIAPGAFVVLDELTGSTTVGFNFGLGGADSARLFLADGTTLIDSYTWAAHAASTYGRCPDGTGSFGATTSTKGAANACGAAPTTTTTVAPSGALPWPGDQGVQTVDVAATFASNMSGLDYEPTGTATRGVLWAARNGAGTLFKLVADGFNWVPATGDGWDSGKALRYPGGTGDPDAEGVTMTDLGSAGGLYVSTERNNAASGVSRNSILRVDPAAAGSTLTATHEWNLTADLPATGANLGMEAITWIPDTFLVANNFKDQGTNQPYNPLLYPNHGAGLFFVGLEANGMIYAYALDHVGGGFTRIASFASGFPGLVDLQFDNDLHDLWAVCDDTCSGRHAVLRADPLTGTFGRVLLFDRPTGMPNINNEGFAITGQAECVADRKPVFWSDDNSTGGFAIRRGTVPCTAVTVTPPPDVPEFPAGTLQVLLLGGVVGTVVVTSRRRRPAI